MKWYRGPDGDERLWFEPDEIENMMDDESRKAGLFPTLGEPVLDIERFIERHLRAALDQHAALDPTVLGATEFRRGAAPRILINRDLTNSALDEGESPSGVLGRWRATLAHEAAHVVIHRVLFELNGGQPTLLGSPPGMGKDRPGLLQCLKREVSFAGSGRDWREVQANKGMAALLMPRPVFTEAAREEMNRLQLRVGHLQASSPEAVALTAGLASRFQVSRQAALIRLQTLGLASPPGQGGLLLPGPP